MPFLGLTQNPHFIKALPASLLGRTPRIPRVLDVGWEGRGHPVHENQGVLYSRLTSFVWGLILSHPGQWLVPTPPAAPRK